MQIGSARETIIVSLLIYKFGEQNVKHIPITETEIDVDLYGQPISIKTITTKKLGSGVKVIWTVDPHKAREFVLNYKPICDILLVQLNWEGSGTFALIPLKVQQEVYNNIGKDNYLTLPKEATNPRGVEFSKTAMQNLINHPDTRKIDIPWIRSVEEYNPYKRWVDYWSEEN